MERSIRPARVVTGAWLLLLLTAPLALPGHVHVADHDGGTAHLEAPHGDHEVLVLEQSDRLPSTQLERSTSVVASVVHAPVAVDVEIGEGHVTDADRPPARGPPGPHRSRAPPQLI